MICNICKKTGGCEHTDIQFPYSTLGEMKRLGRALKAANEEIERLKKELQEKENRWQESQRTRSASKKQ